MQTGNSTESIFFSDPCSQVRISYRQLATDLNKSLMDSPSPTYAQILKILRQLGYTESSFQRAEQQSPELQTQLSIETSGTTKSPREVLHSAEKLFLQIKCGDEYTNNIWGLTYPVSKFAGVQVLLQALKNKNTLIQLPTNAVLEAGRIIQSFGITHLSATPTYFRMLLSRQPNFPDVRQITCGGEPLDEVTLSRIRDAFPNSKFTNIFATTETGVILKSHSTWFEIPEELKTKVKISDEKLMVHASMLGDFEGKPDHYYATGDRVQITSENPLQFVISGRQQELINVGGNTVNLHNVEKALLTLPHIVDARAFGKKNSVMSWIVGCEVILQEGISLDAINLRRQLSNLLPKYAVPMVIEETTVIKLTSTGKKARS